MSTEPKPATGRQSYDQHSVDLEKAKRLPSITPEPKPASGEWTAEREKVEWLTTPSGNHYRVPDTNCGVERQVERLLKEINTALAAERSKVKELEERLKSYDEHRSV